MAAHWTVLSSIWKLIVKWFVKVGWPWVAKNIWPAIQKELIGIFVAVISQLKKLILEWLSNRQKRREEEARQNAEEASRQSQQAETEAEAEKFRAIAQVWREVAEQFRQETQDLKIKLDEAVREATSDFTAKVNKMDVEGMVETVEGSAVKVRGSDKAIPLPPPDSARRQLPD